MGGGIKAGPEEAGCEGAAGRGESVFIVIIACHNSKRIDAL
jgi:hypothetical protein